jgi:hypothetical protein
MIVLRYNFKGLVYLMQSKAYFVHVRDYSSNYSIVSYCREKVVAEEIHGMKNMNERNGGRIKNSAQNLYPFIYTIYT